jgi:hypothetical protein
MQRRELSNIRTESSQNQFEWTYLLDETYLEVFH